MIPILGDIIHEVGGIVAKVVPDADKRMELQLQLAQLADQADVRENQLLQGQIEVDKVEASNSNLFVSGWRPFIGWTCGVALGYTWILAPIGKAVFHLADLPIIDPSQIYPIVTAMLGIAGMRTYEKVQGVAAGGTPTIPSMPSPKSISTSVVSKTQDASRSIGAKIGKWFK